MMPGGETNARRGSALGAGDFSDEEFAAIRSALKERRHFDLGSYKDNCIRRRIARRIRALGLDGAEPYLELLRRNEDELDALLAALTIHVSQFFRNPGIFATLKEKVLPEIVRHALRLGRRELRLWSAGCSSGEEPYSLALLAEEMNPELSVSILGTDVSDEILRKARAGLYDPLRLTDLPLELKSRYFDAEGTGFRLHERIRSRVRFQHHDLLAPSAYPASDLIVCRNVLIYLSRLEQEEILRRFAAALRDGGWLVLGKAETLLGEARRLFAGEYPADRIYRRIKT